MIIKTRQPLPVLRGATLKPPTPLWAGYLVLGEVPWDFPRLSHTLRGTGTHRAHTVHLFYFDDLPSTIVLLSCCPGRCHVAELVPHFTLHALRTAMYMLFLGL